MTGKGKSSSEKSQMIKKRNNKYIPQLKISNRFLG